MKNLVVLLAVVLTHNSYSARLGGSGSSAGAGSSSAMATSSTESVNCEEKNKEDRIIDYSDALAFVEGPIEVDIRNGKATVKLGKHIKNSCFDPGVMVNMDGDKIIVSVVNKINHYEIEKEEIRQEAIESERWSMLPEFARSFLNREPSAGETELPPSKMGSLDECLGSLGNGYEMDGKDVIVPPSKRVYQSYPQTVSLDLEDKKEYEIVYGSTTHAKGLSKNITPFIDSGESCFNYQKFSKKGSAKIVYKTKATRDQEQIEYALFEQKQKLAKACKERDITIAELFTNPHHVPELRKLAEQTLRTIQKEKMEESIAELESIGSKIKGIKLVDEENNMIDEDLKKAKGLAKKYEKSLEKHEQLMNDLINNLNDLEQKLYNGIGLTDTEKEKIEAEMAFLSELIGKYSDSLGSSKNGVFDKLVIAAPDVVKKAAEQFLSSKYYMAFGNGESDFDSPYEVEDKISDDMSAFADEVTLVAGNSSEPRDRLAHIINKKRTEADARYKKSNLQADKIKKEKDDACRIRMQIINFGNQPQRQKDPQRCAQLTQVEKELRTKATNQVNREYSAFGGDIQRLQGYNEAFGNKQLNEINNYKYQAQGNNPFSMLLNQFGVNPQMTGRMIGPPTLQESQHYTSPGQRWGQVTNPYYSNNYQGAGYAQSGAYGNFNLQGGAYGQQGMPQGYQGNPFGQQGGYGQYGQQQPYPSFNQPYSPFTPGINPSYGQQGGYGPNGVPLSLYSPMAPQGGARGPAVVPYMGQ